MQNTRSFSPWQRHSYGRIGKNHQLFKKLSFFPFFTALGRTGGSHVPGDISGFPPFRGRSILSGVQSFPKFSIYSVTYAHLKLVQPYQRQGIFPPTKEQAKDIINKISKRTHFIDMHIAGRSQPMLQRITHRPGLDTLFPFASFIGASAGHPFFVTDNFKDIAGGDGTYGDARCSTSSARASHLRSLGGPRQA